MCYRDLRKYMNYRNKILSQDVLVKWLRQKNFESQCQGLVYFPYQQLYNIDLTFLIKSIVTYVAISLEFSHVPIEGSSIQTINLWVSVQLLFFHGPHIHRFFSEETQVLAYSLFISENVGEVVATWFKGYHLKPESVFVKLLGRKPLCCFVSQAS